MVVRGTFPDWVDGEYFDARELQAQPGQPISNFATVALKELLDNTLDACEASVVAPEVSVVVHEEVGDSTRFLGEAPLRRSWKPYKRTIPTP